MHGVPCFRPILRDPNVGDGELRLLLLLKASAKYGMVEVEQGKLAKALFVTRKTILRRIARLNELRLIKVVPHSRRGLRVENAYFLDDAFFAQHLAKKKPSSRWDKNVPGVPKGIFNIPKDRLCEDPPNVIPMPTQKRKKKA